MYEGCPANLYQALVSSAGICPDRKAAADDFGHTLTYKELLQKTDQLANCLLRDFSVTRGAHVAMMMYNSVDFGIAFLALNKLGAVVVPLQTKYRKDEILSVTERADVSCIITEQVFADWFSSFHEQGIPVLVCQGRANGFALDLYCSGDDSSCPESDEAMIAYPFNDALLIFTSGTTSRSKGVLLKNYNVMHAVISYEKTLHITSLDTTVIPVPMYLVTGLIGLFALFIYVGGTMYIQQFFRAEKVLERIRESQVTFFHASPTVFSLLLGKRQEFPQLPSLNKLACGSSNMPKVKIMQLHEWLPQSSFHTIYGMTETSSPGTVFPDDASVSPYIGSSGIPVPGTVFKIIRDDGSEASADGIGEICISGTNILDSYYKMDTPLLQDNWLYTGDIGYFTPDGYLFVTDRKKDMINRGGEKICSFDVENELYHIEGILEAAVVGIPDEIYGEVPAAVVKTSESFHLSEDELKALLKKKLASYQVPVKILFLKEIPVTPNNKVDKKTIRTLFSKPAAKE